MGVGGGINTLALERHALLFPSQRWAKYVYLLLGLCLAGRQIQIDIDACLIVRPPAAQLVVILFRTGTQPTDAATAAAVTLVALVTTSAEGIFIIIGWTQIGTNTGGCRQLGAHLLAAQIAELIVVSTIDGGIAQAELILITLIIVVEILVIDGAVAIVAVHLIAARGVVLGLYRGQWRELLPVAINLARTACGHLEYVHMQATHLVPAEQTMIVVHLGAV